MSNDEQEQADVQPGDDVSQTGVSPFPVTLHQLDCDDLTCPGCE